MRIVVNKKYKLIREMGLYVPRTLINDLLPLSISKDLCRMSQCASRAGTYMYVKALIVNVNKSLKLSLLLSCQPRMTVLRVLFTIVK